MSFKKIFQRRYLMYWLVGGGAVLLIAAGGLWWFKLSVTPERVFWGMLDQSLSTSGVTMSSTMEQGPAHLRQDVQYSLGEQNRALSRTVLTQPGAEVTTEIIGTLDADYTRYVDVQTETLNAEGQPLDLSKVLNVWAKTENSQGGSPLLSQTVLGLSMPFGSIPVPIGSLNPEQRTALIDQMRNEDVYEVSFGDVKREVKDGRLQYTYDVKMQSIPYVHLMQEFAKAVGLHDLDNLDPNDYQGQPFTVKLTVDVRSRHLVAVQIPDNGFTQTFSSYDTPVAAEIPADTISAQELQTKLDELQ